MECVWGAGREYANLWGSLRDCWSCLVVVGGAEAGITMTEGVFERIVQHSRSHLEAGLYRRAVPAHLLLFVHSPGHDLIDRTLHKGRRDRFAASTPGSVMHPRTLVTLKIAQQLTGLPLETSDAGHVANMLALRPPTQGRELAPASRPAPAARARSAPRHATSPARPWPLAAPHAAAATARHHPRTAPSPACLHVVRPRRAPAGTGQYESRSIRVRTLAALPTAGVKADEGYRRRHGNVASGQPSAAAGRGGISRPGR